MKLTLAMIASVLVCMLSLAARSYAMRAAARSAPEKAYAEQERLALMAIDEHLRGKLQRLAQR
jgi:hypothetical protein